MLASGYAPSTNQGDDGHWRAWEQVCRHMGTSPWRTDMAANSGMDPDGHQEEVFLLASACVRFYEVMMPRRRSDPAAKPPSAGKKVEAIRRRHFTRGIEMVSMKVVKLAIKGMCRQYVDAHGVETLVPRRKLPFPDRVMRDMLRTQNKSEHKRLVVDWSRYHWKAVLVCFSTLAEEGSRKDEVAKASAATEFRKGRFTFDSLRWKIRGEAVVNPSYEQLRTLAPGDGVWLRHGIAKNDPFGSCFAATPSFLAWRDGCERCACRALAELELAAKVPPQARAITPLFGSEPGLEFTHSQLDSALNLLLVCGARVPVKDLADFSVHSFRIYAACALLASDTPRWLIKRMLRWRGDESLELYARVNDDVWAGEIEKTVSATVDSTIASRLPDSELTDEQWALHVGRSLGASVSVTSAEAFDDMDFSPRVRQRFDEIARAMLSLNAATAHDARERL